MASELCGGSCDLGGNCCNGPHAGTDWKADSLDRDRDLSGPSDLPGTERNFTCPGCDHCTCHRRRDVYLDSSNNQEGTTMYTVFAIITSLVVGFVLGMIHKGRVIARLNK